MCLRIGCNMMLLPASGCDGSFSLCTRAAKSIRGVCRLVMLARFTGCTHFIIGRDMAGSKSSLSGEDFYEPYAAQDTAKAHAAELGMQTVPSLNITYTEVPAHEVLGKNCIMAPSVPGLQHACCKIVFVATTDFSCWKRENDDCRHVSCMTSREPATRA